MRRLLAMLSRRAECVAQGSAFAGVSEVIVGGEVSGGDVGCNEGVAKEACKGGFTPLCHDP